MSNIGVVCYPTNLVDNYFLGFVLGGGISIFSTMKVQITLVVVFTMCAAACMLSDGQTYYRLTGIPPTKDVKHINSYSDELGIDASYWLAFECHDSTFKKIVSHLKLQRRDFPSGGFNCPKKWWDTAFISHSNPYHRVDEKERLFWYLWYQDSTQKAYLLTGDY